jgi:hypothetical protein
MLPWALLLGFIAAAVAGVLMGMMAARLQGKRPCKLESPGARDPHAPMPGEALGRKPAARS